MRNLKKILALVLALMMVLSVMVTSSAAFEDAAEIQHSEAVEVMSNLGILLGDGTNFNPNGTLTRAQAAVIIAKMLEGSVDNIAVLVDAIDNPFTDVPAWALDYILYAYSKGVVRGTSADKYTPNKNLTGYEFGKMVLVAAGICKDADFNNNWKVVVAENLKDAGLLAGLSDLVLSKDLSREHAAQMAFNAMLYTAKGSVYYTVSNGTNTHVFADLKEALLYSAILDGYTVNGPFQDYTGSLASDVFALDTFGITEGIGFNGYYWYVDVDGFDGYNYLKDVKVSSFICTDTVIGTYVASTTEKVVAADLGLTSGSATIPAYLNGDPTDALTVAAKGTDKIAKDSSKTLTVVLRADGETVDALWSNEVLCNATRGARVSTDKDSPYYNIYTWTMKDQAGNVVGYTYNTVNGYSPYTKYLVVAQADGTCLSVTEAKTVVGAITGTAAGYIRVGTEPIIKANAGVAAEPDNSTTVTVYLNSQGHAVYVGGYTTVAVAADGYAYLSNLEYKAVNAGTAGLFDNAEASITAKAKIVTTTGETLSVDVATAIVGTAKTPKFYLNGWQTATVFGDVAPVTVGYWVAYNVVDGVYYFNQVADSTVSGVSKNKAYISIEGVDGSCYVTEETEFNVITYYTDIKAASTTTSITGYKASSLGYDNVKAMFNTTAPMIIEKDDQNVVHSITVLTTGVTSATTNFAIYAGLGENSATYGQYYNFIVDGELNSYLITENVTTLPEVGTVVDFDTDVNGDIDSLSAAEVGYSGREIVSVSADGTYFIDQIGYVRYLNGPSYGGVVVVDATAGYAVSELTVGAIVTGYENASGYVEFLVITGYAE